VFGGHASHGAALCAGLLVVHLQGGKTPLMGACEWGHLDVARLLLERGAIVDAADQVGLMHLRVYGCCFPFQ
jgi:ankyrin repeat protein